MAEHTEEASEEDNAEEARVTYKHDWTLKLDKLAPIYAKRKLEVQMWRSLEGSWCAVLVDLAKFRGTGSTQGLAIDDLANALEHIAVEIRRASSLESLAAPKRKS